MIRLLGLDFLSQDALVSVLALIILAAMVAGWIANLVMESSGYGVIGNGFLCLLGSFTALAGWRQLIGPIDPDNLVYVATWAGFGVLVFLILFSLVKRAIA